MVKIFKLSSTRKIARFAVSSLLFTWVQSCTYSSGSSAMQAEEQIPHYTQPRDSDYSELLRQTLEGRQTELSLEESLAVINECVALGQPVVDFLTALLDQGYRPPVIVLGNTGCGKSTFLNWQAGCEMLNHRLQALGGKQIIVVKPIASGGPKDLVTPIGHSRDRSKTFLPIPVLGDNGCVYIDCPGFKDSRGAAINIANLINIKNLIKAIPAAKLILLVDYPSITGSRAVCTTQVLELLISFFGGEQVLLQNKDSISVGITKINIQNNDGLDNLPRLLRFLTADGIDNEELGAQNLNEERVELELDFVDLNFEEAPEQEPEKCNEPLNSRNIFKHFRKRVFTFDPLSRNIGGGLTHEQMCAYIEERIQPLSTSSLQLKNVLSPEDTIALHNIGHKILEKIKATLRLRQGQDYIPDNLVEFRQVSTQLLPVEKLRIIENPKIEEIVLTIYELINSKLLMLKEQCKEKCHLCLFPVSDTLFQALSTAVGYFDISANPCRARIVAGVDLLQLQSHCSTIKTNKQAQDARMNTLESSNTSLQNSFAASQQNYNAQLASLDNQLAVERQQKEAERIRAMQEAESRRVREVQEEKEKGERAASQKVHEAYRSSIISGLKILADKAGLSTKGRDLERDLLKTINYVRDNSWVDFCEVSYGPETMQSYTIQVNKQFTGLLSLDLGLMDLYSTHSNKGL